MKKTIQNHLKSNKGSAYIETVVCLMSLLIVAVILFSASSTLMQKMWLDEKLSDISRLVNSSGTVKSDAITSVENAIKSKFGGGEFTYYANFIDDDADRGLVQLGEVVVISYDNPNYNAFSVGSFVIDTDIHLQKTAVSDVYYKPVNEMVDPIEP